VNNRVAQQSVHLTLGILRRPKHFSRCRVFSTPKADCANAPAQVTQTVGRWREKFLPNIEGNDLL